MANNLVTEFWLSQNMPPKAGVTPGANDNIILTCDEILNRYAVKITPSTGRYCPKQSELKGYEYPSIHTYPVATNITSSSANINGCIDNWDFLGPITSVGVCLNSTGYPTVADLTIPADTIITETTSNGHRANIYCTATTLIRGQHYFARLYVETLRGVFYGDVANPSLDHIVHTDIAPHLEFMPAAYQIGEYFQGGYVAYTFPEGNAKYNPNIQHGVVVDFIVDGYYSWGDALVACENSTYRGFSDWILSEMPNEIIALKVAFPDLFPYPTDAYWTSVPDSDSRKAWAYNLGSETVFTYPKTSQLKTIAQREF